MDALLRSFSDSLGTVTKWLNPFNDPELEVVRTLEGLTSTHATFDIRDTSRDRELFQSLVETTSSEAEVVDPDLEHGRSLIHIVLTEHNAKRRRLLSYKSEDARGVLQVLQKVRVSR
jgi:hypothetical protein